jgi:hypothetical protein
MGVESKVEQTAISCPSVPSHAARTFSSAGESSSTTAEWVARLVIILIACGLAWHTWGHWGDFQIDNGRELYVPAEILKGKLLFRDIWYMYGPLAPYVKALLFRIFGVHLMVLYLFGLALTIGTALVTFEIARKFQLGVVGSAVPALFFLVEAYYPFIRNFVFPYSYAASLGAFLGSACLYFILRHASSARTLHLGFAALLASLAILTKQEFGVACLVLLGFEVASCYLIQRSASRLIRNIAVCFAGLLPAMAGYGWFIWKLSAKFIFFDNWISTPGTYFMRTFAKITMPEQGFRFVPSELLEAAEFTALSVALWALVASFAAYGITKLRLRSHWSIALTALVCLSPLWIAAVAFAILFPYGIVINTTWLTRLLVIPMTQVILPTGMFFLVVIFSIYSLWKLIRGPRSATVVQEAGLGVYASLVAVRQMMELRPTIFKCSVFFNVPAFLIFLILIYRIIRWACRSLDIKRSDFVAVSMLTVEAVMLFILFFPKPQLLTDRLDTPYGSFYTRPDVTILFPQIISFMKTHTQNGKDILVLPEPPSLYVFAGMEAPSRWYSLVPGTLAPEQEQQFIDQVASNQVRYVLITDRSFNEYGVWGFINHGYNPIVYKWIMSNYVKVSQFGPLHDAPYPPFIVWVFEKKELTPTN